MDDELELDVEGIDEDGPSSSCLGIDPNELPSMSSQLSPELSEHPWLTFDDHLNAHIPSVTFHDDIDESSKATIQQMILEEHSYLYRKKIKRRKKKGLRNLFTSRYKNKLSCQRRASYKTRWTEEEKNLFKKGMAEHGHQWSQIALMIKTRSRIQVKNFARTFLQNQAEAAATSDPSTASSSQSFSQKCSLTAPSESPSSGTAQDGILEVDTQPVKRRSRSRRQSVSSREAGGDDSTGDKREELVRIQVDEESEEDVEIDVEENSEDGMKAQGLQSTTLFGDILKNNSAENDLELKDIDDDDDDDDEQDTGQSSPTSGELESSLKTRTSKRKKLPKSKRTTSNERLRRICHSVREHSTDDENSAIKKTSVDVFGSEDCEISVANLTDEEVRMERVRGVRNVDHFTSENQRSIHDCESDSSGENSGLTISTSNCSGRNIPRNRCLKGKSTRKYKKNSASQKTRNLTRTDESSSLSPIHNVETTTVSSLPGNLKNDQDVCNDQCVSVLVELPSPGILCVVNEKHADGGDLPGSEVMERGRASTWRAPESSGESLEHDTPTVMPNTKGSPLDEHVMKDQTTGNKSSASHNLCHGECWVENLSASVNVKDERFKGEPDEEDFSGLNDPSGTIRDIALRHTAIKAEEGQAVCRSRDVDGTTGCQSVEDFHAPHSALGFCDAGGEKCNRSEVQGENCSGLVRIKTEESPNLSACSGGVSVTRTDADERMSASSECKCYADAAAILADTHRHDVKPDSSTAAEDAEELCGEMDFEKDSEEGRCPPGTSGVLEQCSPLKNASDEVGSGNEVKDDENMQKYDEDSEEYEPPVMEEVVLDPRQITDSEKDANPDFFDFLSNTKTPERYLLIRNHIVKCWQKSMPAYLNKTSVRCGLKNGGDVNIIGQIHDYLESIGAINAGTSNPHQRRLKRRHSTLERWSKQDHVAEVSVTRLQSMRPRRKISSNQMDDTTQDNKDSDASTDAKVKRTKTKQSSFYDPFKLIECNPFSTAIPAPFSVRVKADVIVTMDLHCHLSTTEVIGLLGGHYDSDRSVLDIRLAKPCKSLSTGMQCEMDPVSQTEAWEAILSEGCRVVGWYHSHPTFAPNPSIRDIETQGHFQEWFSQDANTPFIGIIVSPYHSMQHVASKLNCLTVSHEWSPELRSWRPYKFDFSVYPDEDVQESHEKQIVQAKHLISEFAKYKYRVEMLWVCPGHSGMTYLEKMLHSLRGNLSGSENLKTETIATLRQMTFDLFDTKCTNVIKDSELDISLSFNPSP